MVKKAAGSEDSAKIKRPMSSYFLFMNDRRNKFKDDNPDMTMCQITKALTEVWKKLTDEEKKKYEDQANKDRTRYEQEMEATGQKVKPTAAQKAKDKSDSGAPKKALGTYFIFLAHNREKVKKENPDLSMCQ